MAELSNKSAGKLSVAQSTAPVVGVIYNPRSHRNRGQDLEVAARPNVHIAQPQEQAEIRTALKKFQQLEIDLLIINGGDGTVRDVLTRGMEVFGDSWPALAVLPKGKTNALNVDLGAPAGWNLLDAIDAYPAGNQIVRRPLSVAAKDGSMDKLYGFILGAGAFTLGVKAGQEAHRLGAFDSLAVGITTVWGILQALFGRDSNVWRRGVKMEIYPGRSGEPLAYSGKGYDGRRMVMLASTLERFPMDFKIFGQLREGLKILVFDRSDRLSLLSIPLIIAGLKTHDPDRTGVHQIATDSFEFVIEDEFVLDGEIFPGGHFTVACGPELRFVVP